MRHNSRRFTLLIVLIVFSLLLLLVAGCEKSDSESDSGIYGTYKLTGYTKSGDTYTLTFEGQTISASKDELGSVLTAVTIRENGICTFQCMDGTSLNYTIEKMEQIGTLNKYEVLFDNGESGETRELVPATIQGNTLSFKYTSLFPDISKDWTYVK